MNKPNPSSKEAGLGEKLYELSYKHNHEITLAMDDTIKLAKEHFKDKALKAFDELLERGYGGGNWRRLITQIREEFK